MALSLRSRIYREILGLIHFRWVWLFNIMVMLKVRYRRSILGFLWSMLGPFSSYAVIASVFYFNSTRSFPDFLSSALPGFLMFNFVSASLNNSPGILLSNENYIRKIYLPKTVFFFGGVASDFVNYFFAQLVVMIVASLMGWISPGLNLLLLPLFWILLFFFVLGISLVIGTLTVFFRDINHIVPIGTQILFYITPVLYAEERMPASIRTVIDLNPFTHFLHLYELVIFGAPGTVWTLVGLCATMSLVSLSVGLLVLESNNNRVIYYL